MRAGLVLSLAAVLVLAVRQDVRGGDKTSDVPKIDLVRIKFPEFMNEIKWHKGKVVVVYFWAYYSVVDCREFPRLMQLHRRHAKDGLVAISTHIAADYEESKAAVFRFLTKQRATIKNLFIEDFEEWRGRIEAPPAILVYARDGKLAGRFEIVPGTFDFAAAEKLVKKLLASDKKD